MNGMTPASRSLSAEVRAAVADYVRVAPNAHLGDTPEAQDRLYARSVIYGAPTISEGIARLQRISHSMEDM